jgi:branched-chain amino acid transport system permease protein
VNGTGILLVEHHGDLICEIRGQVAVLNPALAAATPAGIHVHKEGVNAYLGG